MSIQNKDTTPIKSPERAARDTPKYPGATTSNLGDPLRAKKTTHPPWATGGPCANAAHHAIARGTYLLEVKIFRIHRRSSLYMPPPGACRACPPGPEPAASL